MANPILSVYSASGSGKSTLTHENTMVAMISLSCMMMRISSILRDLSSIALEPTYFDKMQDYPVEHPANEFLLTLQNVGVTMDDEGHKGCIS